MSNQFPTLPFLSYLGLGETKPCETLKPYETRPGTGWDRFKLANRVWDQPWVSVNTSFGRNFG